MLRLKILIIGIGYVGTTTGLVFCELGHQVTGLDIDEGKINSLKSGKLHFYEPGLDVLLQKHLMNRNISFTNDTNKAIRENDVLFICVGTPQGRDGAADLQYVKEAAEEIGKNMDQYKVIVDKSTVPVGTAELVTKWIKAHQIEPIPFDVVSNPEFLREGSALRDAFHPDRIVIGTSSKRAKEIMMDLYKDFQSPIVETDSKAAELIKYAANSFLALKISYINEMARLCETLKIDISDIAEGIGYDKRIGRQFLKAGLGYGGSCFPKDLNALINTAKRHDKSLSILESAMKVNESQPNFFIQKIKECLGEVSGKQFAVLGLSFKENTDDTRESPSCKVIKLLLDENAKVRLHDPIAKPTNQEVPHFEEVMETVSGADAIIICTEWPEYKNLDWNKVKEAVQTPIIFDGRNCLNSDELIKMGFIYKGIGRF